MIQSASHRPLQTGKYFSILKLIILQQNISSVWIFGDEQSWYQRGHEVNIILQHLVGTLPKYVVDSNTMATKTMCMGNENMKILNIFFVSQTFGSKEVNCVCPPDYTLVLVQNSSTKIMLPEKRSKKMLQMTVFGTINDSDIADMNYFQGFPSYFRNGVQMKDLFKKKSLNFNGSDFRIFFQLQPNSMFNFVNGNYIFYGPDALMAHEITKMLNATPVIYTNVGIEYPRYQFWFNSSEEKYRNSQILLAVRKRLIPPNKISDLYQNCSNNMDLCVLGIKGFPKEITEFLYPYAAKCMRIVVPRIKMRKQFAEKLSHNSIVQSTSLTVLLMFLHKIMFDRSIRISDWIQTFFAILAFIFGHKRQKLSTKSWETIWNTQLVFIVIFSTASLSAISYQTLVSVKYVNQIDTLDDLIRSNLKIFVEKSKSSDFEVWGDNLDARLRSNFVYQSELINFMQNQTNDVAYVWEDGMANVHVMKSESSAPNDELSAMRLAKEPLCCGFTSSRMVGGSTIKHSVNTLVHRMFESGIHQLHVEWALEYLRASNRRISSSTHNDRNKFQPLTLSRIHGIFGLLIGGLLFGFIALALEILWTWFTVSKNES